MAKKDKQTVTYPVSTGYRKNWGEWEAVREIVQNAVDTGSRVQMAYKPHVNVRGGKLVVRDYGDGFALKNLLIGESTKDGKSSAGKFGEGMKFALLALVRSRVRVTIHTNGYVLQPWLAEQFDTKVLAIDYWETGTHIKGTRVEMVGIKSNYRERFLSLRLEDNMRERVLMADEHRGKLFVKGIYVKDIPAVAGYNLNMERENPVSGDVDMYRVRDRVAMLIRGTKDRKYMRRVLALLDLEDASDHVELECGKHERWGGTMAHPNSWRDEAKAHFKSDKVCLVSNLDAARTAAYKGWKVVQTEAPFAAGIMKYDRQVVNVRTSDPSARKSKKGLPAEHRANLQWAVRLLQAATRVKIKDVRVISFGSGTLGEGKYRDHISIDPKVLGDRQQTLETIMHEFVHYSWGDNDLTHEFQEHIGQVAATVAIHLATGGGKAPKSTKKTTVSTKSATRRAVRKRWLNRLEGMDNSGDLVDYLHAEPMNVLAQIAGAFGVAPVGKKKGALVYEISVAIVTSATKGAE